MKRSSNETIWQKSVKSSIAKEFVIFLLFFISTVWYFGPVVTHFTSFLPGNYDELFITWSITQMAEKFPMLSPEKLFDDGIFYPNQYSHAFSDMFILSGLIAKPFLWIYKEPVAAFNANLLLGQILTLWAVYLLLKELTKDRLLSAVLSLVFSFSSIHLHYIPHLHTFNMFLVPFSGWVFLKWYSTKETTWVYAWFGCLCMQALNSPLLVYFILLLTAVLASFSRGAIPLFLRQKRQIIIGGLISVLLTAPFGSIYFLVSRIHEYKRPLTEVIHFSLSPEQLITKFNSPALYVLIAFSIGLCMIIKSIGKQAAYFLSGMGMSFLLSLGPALHWLGKTVKIPFHVPLPYLLLYFVMPGFNGFRTPSRWILLFALFGTMFTACIISLLVKENYRVRTLSLAGILLLLAVSTPRNSQYVEIPSIHKPPQVYGWVRNQPQSIIAELPMVAWDKGDQTKEEIMRMYWALYHGKKTVNGYSGFFPNNYLKLTSVTQKQFPDEASIEALKRSGAQLLIIHMDQFVGQGKRLENEILEEMGEPSQRIGQTMVYRLQ